MKNLYFLLFLPLFVISCNNSNTETNTSSTTDDQSNSEKKPKEEKPDISVEVYIDNIMKHASDKKYIADHIYFPFMMDVYKKSGISRAEFDANEYATEFFESINSISINPYVSGNSYINSDLSDFIEKQFGNFDDMYILRQEADPSGFCAYIKLVDKEYKFVGYETTQAN